MKIARVASTAFLSVVLGSTAFVWAQDQHDEPKPPEPRPEATRPPRDEAKPAQETRPEARPEARQQTRQEEGQPQQEKPARPEKPEEAKPRQGEEHPQVPQTREQHPDQRGPVADNHPADNRRGGHVPDDKFRAHFGREHKFAVNHVSVVEGRPRFEYSGYWFSIVDVWPAEWAYTDDCYIDYVDGEYFLFDLLHPGVRIAVVVEL